MSVQIEIKENQHNGRDTHIRQVKIFSPRETKTSGSQFPPMFETVECSQSQTLR
jgi:anaphase-promoting complex subunit 10